MDDPSVTLRLLRRASPIVLVVGLLCGLVAERTTLAQQPSIREAGQPEPSGPFPSPDPDAAVLALLSQDYLTDEERATIALRHGLWNESDLTTPSARALAAATVGRWNDPSLDDPSVSVELRAQALLARGHADRAEAILEGTGTTRGLLLLARTQMQLGAPDRANATLTPLVNRMVNDPINDSDELVDLVEAARLQATLAPPPSPLSNPRAWIASLARAGRELDALSWAAPLAEAELLLANNNFAEIGPAFEQSLARNPRQARTWALFGRLSVNSFDLDKAERIADRLDALSAPTPSIDGAIVRSAARVRRSDWGPALEALGPALAAYPTSRPLLAARSAALAGTFDESRIEAALTEFEGLSPGSPAALIAVGEAFAEARQYEEARRYLSRAVERTRLDPTPFAALGLSELQAGELETARTALTRAAVLDPSDKRVHNSLMLLDELRTFETVESDHFVVRFKPVAGATGGGPDALVAREMLPQLERIYERVTGAERGGIAHAPTGKTTVELYPNHRWFAVRITGMPGIHTIAAATGPVIAMEAPREGAGHSGPYDWARVVQHEYTHTVTLSRTRNRLPHWFTEAGAVYLEDAPRDYSTVVSLMRAFDTDALFDFASINIAFVRPRNPSDRSLAYAQGHWMYEYIIDRWGSEAPLQLMDLYAAGVSEPDAFSRVLNTTREQFLTDFKSTAREQLVAWGMKLPEGVPSLREIMKEEEVADSGDLSEATLDGLLVLHPGHPDLLKLRAERAVPDNGRGGEISTEAVPHLEAYARARPVDPWPRRMLAQFALNPANAAGSHDLLIPHLEYLDVREQSSPVWAMELARRYAAIGDSARSETKALRATRISPYDARPRELAATLALRRGDLDGAEAQLIALTILEPEREIHQQRLEGIRKRR